MIDIIYTYYNQNVYLTEYFKCLDKFILSEFTEKLNFILIDDGSKEYPARDYLPDLTRIKLDLYEIEEDIPWNLSGGRNLGVSVARNNNVCYIDIDSILTNDHINELLNINLKEKEIYQFASYDYKYFDFRRNIYVYNYLPSPFFMRKQDFLQYPMDEDFCGNWGHENTHWLRVLKKNGFTKKQLKSLITVSTRTNIDINRLSKTVFSDNEKKKWAKRAGGTNLIRPKPNKTPNLELLDHKSKILSIPKDILRFNYKLVYSNNII